MTNDSMIRGALPLAWLALIGSTALLYSLPASDPVWGDPVWGDVIATLRQWHTPLPAALLLALLTFLLGFPSKKELVAATTVGIAASVALAALTAIASIGWLLIAVFFLVVPLSGFLFRRLMLRRKEASGL